MPTDQERYAHAVERCDARARATTTEIRELWLSIAASYRFLRQREERLEAEDSERSVRD
jgi:hypothetical protein